MYSNTADVGDLAEALNATNPFLEDDERELALAIYRLLSEGEPVAPEDVARQSGADLDWVRKRLDDWTGVFKDHDGRIVAF